MVIMRDLLLAGKTAFSELARPEGIATNVLTDRLTRLEKAGIIRRERDPSDGRRRRYVPTERGESLRPVLLELAIFGVMHCGGSDHNDIVATTLAARGA
ncbi:MAG: DNA-binding HxlR family transcriptional regulator [Myxococcota bacterium]|jgi:DNA-binding HxlR family transcriptional regulator